MPNQLDNTLKSVERLSRNNGFEGWMMVNICAQRSTNPDGMHIEINNEIHQSDLRLIDNLLFTYPRSTLWAA